MVNLDLATRLLYSDSSRTGRNTSTKSISQSFFFCQDCLLLWSDPQVPDRTVCHYILRTSGLFTALYSDETSRFQLATLAPLCEVISRADKRAARGGSKGTNYPRCLDGWQRGQQQRANLCRETHLREEDEARSQISRLQAPERFRVDGAERGVCKFAESKRWQNKRNK